MITTSILFLAGLAALLWGARLLISAALQLAYTVKCSSLTIGLTVVAFGTSTPEIGITLLGAWKGEGSLIIGNIVGSNILNILLVLGICASIKPLFVQKQLIWWDVPLMIGSTLLFWLLASTHVINRLGGLGLLTGIVCYLIFTYVMLKKNPPKQTPPPHRKPIWLQVVWLILGLILLGTGSELLITNAIHLAHFWGVSDLFIGLTVIALGTSLPELATTLIAQQKGESDLVVGNIVGSNLVNLLAVIGMAGLISPIPIIVPQKALTFDIPIMVGVTIATLPIFLTGHRISRWEGILFLVYYGLYILLLVFTRLQHQHLLNITIAVSCFILPFTLISLIVGVWRHFTH